jgi:hypothetical protein
MAMTKSTLPPENSAWPNASVLPKLTWPTGEVRAAEADVATGELRAGEVDPAAGELG